MSTTCLPERPSRKSRATPAGDGKHHVSHQTYLTGAVRDVETLITIRRGDVIGKRNHMLFLWCTWSFTLAGMGGDSLEAAAQSINQRFVDPLPDWEVRSIAKSAATEFVNQTTGEVRARRFRSANVLATLAVTPDEQRRMVVLIGADERRRRNRQRMETKRRASGMQSHAEKAQETLQRVREALERPGVLTDSELAAMLGVSRPTARKYRTMAGQTSENL